MSRTQTFFAAGLLTLAAACGGHNTPNDAIIPAQPATLRVENDRFNDMRIYVHQGGQRLRLGTATGKSTSKFNIPKSIVTGLVTLRFEADPIGGNGASVSEEITVQPGDEITLRIPPL